MKTRILRAKAFQHLRKEIELAENKYKNIGLKVILNKNYSCGNGALRIVPNARIADIGTLEISGHKLTVPFDEFCYTCYALNHELRHITQTQTMSADIEDISNLISYLVKEGNPVFYDRTYNKNYSEIDATIYSVVETRQKLTDSFPDYDSESALVKLINRMSQMEASRFTAEQRVDDFGQMLSSMYQWQDAVISGDFHFEYDATKEPNIQDSMYQRLTDETTQSVARAFRNARSWDEQQIIVAKYSAMEYQHPEHFPLLQSIQFPTVAEICEQKIPTMEQLARGVQENQREKVQNPEHAQNKEEKERISNVNALVKEKRKLLLQEKPVNAKDETKNNKGYEPRP